MTKSTLQVLPEPVEVTDPLHELLRTGAQQLIASTVEAKLAVMLAQFARCQLEDGRQAVVRNGFLPERSIQTGIGDVCVKVPKVRDRSGNGIRFNSTLLPPYLKRAKSVEELLPWLYLRGISIGDFNEALSALFGEGASGLSASTISRLKAQWLDENQAAGSLCVQVLAHICATVGELAESRIEGAGNLEISRGGCLACVSQRYFCHRP